MTGAAPDEGTRCAANPDAGHWEHEDAELEPGVRAVVVGNFRVLTLNLWGERGHWRERRQALRDGLRVADADLLAFQEAVRGGSCDRIADLVGQEFHVAHQRTPAPDGAGTCIASRWPIEELHEVDLRVSERNAEHAPATQIARIRTPPEVGPVLLVNHKPSWQPGFELERERQAVAAARHVEQLIQDRPAHVVLAGDFDAVPDAASLRFWTGRQSLGETSVCYQDAWEVTHPGERGHTFTPRNPLVRQGEDLPRERGRRTDYVLVRCGARGPTLDVVRCELAFDQPQRGVWASDHFAVTATLCPNGLLAPPG